MTSVRQIDGHDREEDAERLVYVFELAPEVIAALNVQLPQELLVEIESATVSKHLRLCSSSSVEFQQGKDSTGLRVYLGARVLCMLLHFMISRSRDFLSGFTESAILELGCGCGLAGTFASHFARKVVLTDREDM